MNTHSRFDASLPIINVNTNRALDLHKAIVYLTTESSHCSNDLAQAAMEQRIDKLVLELATLQSANVSEDQRHT